MAGIWRNNPDTPEGKYPIVLRRDGSPVTTPYFVLLMRDPCFAAAITAYADEAERRNYDPQYVSDLREMVEAAPRVLAMLGPGDPDAPRHRTDDPVTLAWARSVGAHGA